jgi:hypothetical protein
MIKGSDDRQQVETTRTTEAPHTGEDGLTHNGAELLLPQAVQQHSSPTKV